MSQTRREVIESARKAAFMWKSSPATRELVRGSNRFLADELDVLLGLCSEKSGRSSDHMTGVNADVNRRPENGYQPEHEFYWYCSCRPGKTSGDMGMLSSAHGARGIHEQDPTQFPGWLE